MINILRLTFIVALFVSLSGKAVAREDFLQAWEEVYPSSLSSQRRCQLCHYQSTGGDGWNGYGFTVRNQFIDLNRSDIKEAFRLANLFDSDLDQRTNAIEIEQGFDPGWRTPDNNFVFFKDGLVLSVASPFTDTDINPNSLNDEICIPIQAKRKTASRLPVILICL